ncbi:hypothetical protein Nepgr_026416 [Nepenthes gracilis]|uniref:Nucleolar protein 6 n=1 Tax=Nepenthes gracilis TaxID=150966 RepID=A0AAD3T6Z3_NEPGR|nr:hypothetical protein Nepgr_026416 [Nepenthes gracilis]
MTSPLELKWRELLKEVQLDYSPAFVKFVDDTVSSIKEAINRIPDDLQVTEKEAPGFVKDLGANKVQFKFKKPKSIEIGGSYSIRCIAKPDVNIDLLIRLPKECFLEKDYLNYRYHAKRCLYLCTIKKYLKSSLLLHRVEWSTLQNEARKPILVVYPEAPEIAGFSVRLIPTATSLFSITKLNVTRNNIRALQKGDVSEATPKYNCSILEDLLMEEFAEFMQRTFLRWKELGEALVLLKVWARQRSSIYGHDCLSGYLISIVLSYLATECGRNRINNSMNTMQIFRVTLDFIANSKSWDIGLSFWSQGESKILKEEMKGRKQHLQSFPVVICDMSGYFNLAFRMTKTSFSELQDEAAQTVACIEKCRGGGFEELFLTKIDFPAKYDYCIRLSLKGNNDVYASGYCMNDECWRLYENKVHSLVSQGLGDRAKFIRVIWRNCFSDVRIEDGFSSMDKEPLLVGITVNSLDKALRVVDVGPHAENKEEVAMFRKFWGGKSELRRFKDGTIAESTVWQCKPSERHHIIKRIVEYVVSQHLSLPEDNVTVVADQLDFSLTHGGEDPISCFGNLLEAYELLAKRLRHLEDIPLRVSSVQPLDSAFRSTSVFPPKPHPLVKEEIGVLKLQKLSATCIQPLEVVIQLEGSGNWPMDDVVTEKIKSAFLLKIGESLESHWGMTCIASEDNVDVLLLGYAFRLKILHERGLSLLKRQIGGNQVKRVSFTDKKLFLRSQHSSMINGLQGRYPVFGSVVRLAKRWVASHLFSACLVGEAIELLVAHLFVKPWPFRSPSSRITGFLRFLRLLSEYDWSFYPLIVDINNDLTPDDEKEINENFASSRKASEGNPRNVNPAMFLASAYDTLSEAWTTLSPNSEELKRLVAYARSSANLLNKLILQHQSKSYQWEQLFRTPLNNYDAVVLLHGHRLAYPLHLIFPSEVNEGVDVARGNASKAFHPFLVAREMKGGSDELKKKLMVDFDPLRCYLSDLEREFPNVLKLWYDALGGDAIGLTWDKSISKKRGRENGGEGEDIINVLKAVGEIGKGFVRSVHLLKAPRDC